MQVSGFFQSKGFKIAIYAAAICAVVFFIFGMGMLVGFKKAKFSYQWGDNYHRNFAGPKGGFIKEIQENVRGNDFIEAHGVFGQIIKIDGRTLIIKGQGGAEMLVSVQDNAPIMRFKETVNFFDLKVDDRIVTIGDPDNRGGINAKLIRIMPPPPPPHPDFFNSSTPNK